MSILSKERIAEITGLHVKETSFGQKHAPAAYSTVYSWEIVELAKMVEALTSQLESVVAENAALKAAFNPEEIPDEAVEAFTETAIMDHDWDDIGSWSWVDNDTDVIRAVLEAIKPETPVTDAILAEVRNESGARAVELFAQTLGSPYSVRDEKSYEDGFTRAIEVVRDIQAPRFAYKIRQAGM